MHRIVIEIEMATKTDAAAKRITERLWDRIEEPIIETLSAEKSIAAWGSNISVSRVLLLDQGKG